MLFGKKALEDQQPFGLKRMSEEDFPEIYPATTSEWAAPLPGDEPGAAAIRPLLAKTQLERKPLRLAYDANRDGWSSDAFHAAVDTFGAAVSRSLLFLFRHDSSAGTHCGLACPMNVTAAQAWPHSGTAHHTSCWPAGPLPRRRWWLGRPRAGR